MGAPQHRELQSNRCLWKQIFTRKSKRKKLKSTKTRKTSIVLQKTNQNKSNFKENPKPEDLIRYSFQVYEQNQETGYDPLLYVTSFKNVR